MAQIVTITNPLTGQPAQVDQLEHTAQQIDDGIGFESTDYPGCYYRMVGSVVEWFNPPMLLGVEYRTTERYLGKPVYAKIVNCGESIASSDSFIDIPSGISDYDSTVALNVRAGEFSLPAYYSGGSPMGNTYVDAFMYGSTIRFRSGWNLTRNIYAFIKYTKTTD